MSTELTVRTPAPVALSTDQLQYIANTEFVPPGLRGNLPAILACVATGREIGIGDMVALKSIHLIDGKATFSAELMVMLVRRQGHSITGEVSAESATVTGTRTDNGDTMTVTWTLEMAERAGLLNKSNWRKYTESMLWARAASQLCRMLFADCFAGATYTTEELGDENTAENGAPADSAAGTPFSYDHDEPLDPPLEQILSKMPSEVLSPEVPPTSEGAPPPITEAQKKKANVLVGKLRPEHISTLQLWQSMGREPVPSEDGLLHWSPLRDSLTRAEAHELIDRLDRFAAEKLAAA